MSKGKVTQLTDVELANLLEGTLREDMRTGNAFGQQDKPPFKNQATKGAQTNITSPSFPINDTVHRGESSEVRDLLWRGGDLEEIGNISSKSTMSKTESEKVIILQGLRKIAHTYLDAHNITYEERAEFLSRLFFSYMSAEGINVTYCKEVLLEGTKPINEEDKPLTKKDLDEFYAEQKKLIDKYNAVKRQHFNDNFNPYPYPRPSRLPNTPNHYFYRRSHDWNRAGSGDWWTHPITC